MKNLFDVLEGIKESGYEKENLSCPDAVQRYAEAGGMFIDSDLAESIIRVAVEWNDKIENGNGEWSAFRHDAKRELVCYMHEWSGDVASREMWRDDFENMDIESWFGKEASECKDLHWLDDQPYLVEVEWSAEEKEWVETE